MSRERFVLDTNVIVSAVLSPRSVPRKALDRAFLLGTVLVSDSILVELDDVLRRPKFERYVSEEERLQFLAKFVGDATIVEVTEVVTDCRDSKDNKFLELAVSGGANCIISGDNDLLVLDPFRGIPIITPQVFISVVTITNRINIEIKDINPRETQALMDEIEARISDDFLF